MHDPWINHRVQDIDGQIDYQEEYNDQQNAALSDGQITFKD
jgi:hypothetical protein